MQSAASNNVQQIQRENKELNLNQRKNNILNHLRKLVIFFKYFFFFL